MSNTGKLGPYTVTRMGFGVMQLALERDGAVVPRAQALTVLRRALELGVTHFDTAQFYGDGLANELIREALAPYPDDVVVATKVGAARDGSGALVAAQRPEDLRAQVQANLTTLGVDRLDLVNLRRIDDGAGIRAEGDQVVDLDDQLAELVALRDAGTIGAIGLSNVDADQLARALPVAPACVQNRYNVLERADEGLLQTCAEHSVAWVPFFPLGSAFDHQRQPADELQVQEIADRMDVSPQQVCLAWLLAHDPHVLLIAGTTSVGHLESNVAAAQLLLDPDDVHCLDALAGG